MNGLVNKAIEDIALEEGGQEIWDAIRRKAGVDVDTFMAMDTYPDDVTYGLVKAASDVLDISVSDLLRKFGNHWVLFTGKAGYGPLIDMTGDSLPEVLENLNLLHQRVASRIPNIQTPTFHCTEPRPGELVLEYHSSRDGLAPMVEGLIEGLGERFDTQVVIRHTGHRAELGHDVFEVSYQPMHKAA